MADDLLTTFPTKEKKKKLPPAERRAKLRERLWPGSGKLTWHRKEHDGYITMPKLLSLVCVLIKDLAGTDPTRVYLDLWFRSFDEAIIQSVDEDEAAFSAGYSGTRAKRTWIEHMRKLEELGFIQIASEGISSIGHVLLLNPIDVVHKLRHAPKSRVLDEWWNAYVARAVVVGAVLPSADDE